MNGNDSLLANVRQQLTDLLQSRRCINGHFRMERPADNMLLTMHGDRPGLEKPLFFWEWPNPVKRSISAFLDANPDVAVLEIQLDFAGDTFEVHTQSRAEYEAWKEQEAEKKYRELRQAQFEKREVLLTRTKPYGTALAQKVTEQLLKGYFLGYGHRDYCGTGLQKNGDGKIVYGELYDGGMIQAIEEFETPEAFTEWLALQSDASMALLESPSPFYWGNQTLTEERLREFAAFVPGELH